MSVRRQIDRVAAVLSDVVRSGGKDGRAHLKSHGHHGATIRSAVDRGCLRELVDGRYEITDDGNAFLIWHRLLPKAIKKQT